MIVDTNRVNDITIIFKIQVKLSFYEGISHAIPY